MTLYKITRIVNNDSKIIQKKTKILCVPCLLICLKLCFFFSYSCIQWSRSSDTFYFSGPLNKNISKHISHLSICNVLVPIDQNISVLYAGGPNFLYFTTVIVINFEADYLLNPWTGVPLVHSFWFPATFITGKNWSDLWLWR